MRLTHRRRSEDVARPSHVAICNWRDLRHPEGGGSELYVENIARGLAASGNQVTLLSAAVPDQPRDETRDGIRYRRRGGRHSVYLHAAWALLSGRVRPDVVIDVQNGVPFLSSLVTRRPVVALVHHVHREQWPIVFGPRAARVGWWVESRLGPWLYRRSSYVAVSEATRAELAELSIDPDRVSVVRNGTPELARTGSVRSRTPRVIVLGRLVPHKRVEVVLRAVAALRPTHPDLHVDVVGQGWHDAELHDEVTRLGIDSMVTFHGFVDEQRKSDLLAEAWVNAVPSVKEGWALAVVEAAGHATPSLAFAGAGGLDESIVDGVTGVLVDGDDDAYTAALATLLSDHGRRTRLGEAAQARAACFSWDTAVKEMSELLESVSA